MREALAQAEPDLAATSLAAGTGVVWRLLRAMEIGDAVITYHPARRRYAVGEVASDSIFDPSLDVPLARKDHCHLRRVLWRGEISRSDLSKPAADALMPTLTLFQVRPEAEREIRALEPAPYAAPRGA